MDVRDKLRERLIAGEQSVGCWIHMCSNIATEVIGLAGFDFAVIDHEHGPNEMLNSISLMQALSSSPCTPIMRAPWTDHVYIKRLLDIGAQGIIIPSVDTADQARAAVAACRFPPDGVRGAAYPLVRASKFGFKTGEYMDGLPENILVMCQVESATAVENIDEILAVEGIDVFFIGPLDMSASMGIIGQTKNPEFIKTRARAEKAIKDAGRWMGGLAVAGDPVQAMQERGYDLITGVSDVSLLRDAAIAHLGSLGRGNKLG